MVMEKSFFTTVMPKFSEKKLSDGDITGKEELKFDRKF
jgi:hypothetical protein